MAYDKNNVFYKIIHKEVKSNIILEGEYFVAIHDIAPKAPVHVLVIPKGEYTNMYEFLTKASKEEILDLNQGIARIIDMMKLTIGGYRIIENSGKFGMQEVPHMHVHVMGNSAD